MDVEEYKRKVIELFRNGNPTFEQWYAMAEAVLNASESEEDDVVDYIDDVIDPLCKHSLYNGYCGISEHLRCNGRQGFVDCGTFEKIIRGE